MILSNAQAYGETIKAYRALIDFGSSRELRAILNDFEDNGDMEHNAGVALQQLMLKRLDFDRLTQSWSRFRGAGEPILSPGYGGHMLMMFQCSSLNRLATGADESANTRASGFGYIEMAWDQGGSNTPKRRRVFISREVVRTERLESSQASGVCRLYLTDTHVSSGKAIMALAEYAPVHFAQIDAEQPPFAHAIVLAAGKFDMSKDVPTFHREHFSRYELSSSVGMHGLYTLKPSASSGKEEQHWKRYVLSLEALHSMMKRTSGGPLTLPMMSPEAALSMAKQPRGSVSQLEQIKFLLDLNDAKTTTA